MTSGNELEESGILLVDKPSDWTSHDVVNCVRRRFHIRKVGHCGTLDPMATGLLVLLLGKATKLSSRLMEQDKVYSGVMRLGVRTDTDDRDGNIISTCVLTGVTEEKVRLATARFVGDIQQIPPMVSAVKKDGQPLYKLARKGQTVEREARPVTIHSIEITRIALPDVTVTVSCSKGTYIRVLCADIGQALGCGAHLHDLRRLRSGRFSVDDAHGIEDIKNWDRETLCQKIIPIGALLVQMVGDRSSREGRSA